MMFPTQFIQLFPSFKASSIKNTYPLTESGLEFSYKFITLRYLKNKLSFLLPESRKFAITFHNSNRT